MKHIKQILITVLLLATAISCKKYEEGPNFTLRTAKARLTGTWEVTKFQDYDQNINWLEPDSFELLVTDCGDTLSYSDPIKHNVEVEFKRNKEADVEKFVYGEILDRGATTANCVPVYTPFEETRNFTGNWEFKDGRDILSMPLPTQFKNEDYVIVKLTKSDMKLTGVDINYEVEMKKK